jgi:hypothetical protein
MDKGEERTELGVVTVPLLSWILIICDGFANKSSKNVPIMLATLIRPSVYTLRNVVSSSRVNLLYHIFMRVE